MNTWVAALRVNDSGRKQYRVGSIRYYIYIFIGMLTLILLITYTYSLQYVYNNYRKNTFIHVKKKKKYRQFVVLYFSFLSVCFFFNGLLFIF